MPANRPLHLISTLLTLPTEVLAFIVSHLNDRGSAISLARVSKVFGPLTESAIYRDLDLFLPPRYTDPSFLSQIKSGPAYADMGYMTAGGIRDVALKNKVNKILLESGARRLGMVKKVTVASRAAAVRSIVNLLDILSPHLESLEFRGLAPDEIDDEKEIRDRHTIDIRLYDYTIIFTRLTHLKFTKGAVRYAETVNLVCLHSKNLVSLDVEMSAESRVPKWQRNRLLPAPVGYEEEAEFPNLRNIRMTFYDRRGERKDRHPFIRILEASPRLQQLCLRYVTEDPVGEEHIEKVLKSKLHLQDLYWDTGEDDVNYGWRYARRYSGFPALKRLVVCAQYFLHFITDLPSSPNCEVLHVLDGDFEYSNMILHPPPPSRFSEPPSPVSMLPSIAITLRAMPKLATIKSLPMQDIHFERLDDIEQSNSITGFIRSFTHNGDELLHARLLSQFIETSDVPHSHHLDRGVTQVYVAPDDSLRLKIFGVRCQSQWWDMTDYNGYKVPLEIIQQMREVQGVSLAEWQGRGVEVGDQAWQVLTDWMAKLQADGEKEA